jgi:hypothetical protein
VRRPKLLGVTSRQLLAEQRLHLGGTQKHRQLQVVGLRPYSLRLGGPLGLVTDAAVGAEREQRCHQLLRARRFISIDGIHRGNATLEGASRSYRAPKECAVIARGRTAAAQKAVRA